MNKKKVIFAVAIFVALGLFLFTFANPKENDDATNNDIVKPTANEVEPEVETEKNNEEEIVEPAAATELATPANNQNNNFANVVTPANNNVPRVEPQQPTTDPVVEPVVEPVEPTPVYYNVKFIGFNNEVVKEVSVLEGSSVEAPVVNDVTKDNVVYTFTGWDKEAKDIASDIEVNAIYEITSITASIVTDKGADLGTIALKVEESLFDAIANPGVVTTNQEVIEGLVDGTLPTTDKLNYKYIFPTLEYVPEVGFVITAKLVVDEEALARNTVILTYVIEDNAFFFGGSKVIVTKTTNGYNKVVLPKVFVGFNEVNVIWTDANGELKEGYTSSMVIKAKLDKQGPVITLKGLAERELFATNGSYREEGFTVTDNYTRLTERDVKVTIKLGNKEVNKVDYTKPGTYTITYTAVDTEGNVGTAKRVITVKKVELASLELSKTTGTYFVNDSMEDITVTAVYNNETRKVLNKQTCRYYYGCTDGYTQDKEFDSSSKGNKSITYSYKDGDVTKKATYTYEVTKIELDSLELSKTTGTYFVGDSMESITVTAVYTDGSKKVLNKQTCSYNRCSDGYTQDKEFNSSSKGSKSITYSYKDGDVTKKATYTYEVNKIELASLELSKTTGTYFIGDSMDDITVTAVYTDGSKKVLNKQTCRYYSCTDGYTQDKEFNSNTSGNKSIVYSYKDDGVTKTATYTYEVKKIELASLELSKTTGTYFVNDSMDDITVTAVYTDGSRKVLNKQTCRYGSYSCTDGYTQDKEFSSSSKGNKSITYSYKDGGITKTATYTYEVKEAVVTGIELSSYYGSYIVGDEMEHLDVYVVYSNGRKEKVDHYSVQGFNTNKNNVGNGHVITVNYKGMKANYTYDVKYHAEIGKEYAFFFLGDCYLQFDIPNSTSINSITFYDENGTKHGIAVNGYSKITISREEYEMIHAMDGTNSNQKLVVSFNVKGQEIVSTYTRVVND